MEISLSQVINRAPNVGADRSVHAVIFSDIHAPVHSTDWVRRALGYSETLDDSRVAVVAGDTCDFASLAFHAPHQTPPSTEEEVTAARQVLGAIAEHFDKVYVTFGNHEHRASRRLPDLTPSLVMHMLVDGLPNNVTASPYWYSWLNQKKWFVVHPEKYSKDVLKVARKISDDMSLAEGRPVSVIAGHEHHGAKAAVGQNRVVICNPTLQDYNKTAYLTHHHLSQGYPPWAQGFTHVRPDGGSRVFSYEDAPYLDSLSRRRR